MSKARWWTAEREAELRRRWDLGEARGLIAVALGTTPGAVSNAANAFGLLRRMTATKRESQRFAAPVVPFVAPAEVEWDDQRETLPAGHPVSWGLLTNGTVLEGAPYA